ncbi:hypothetical protein [Salinivibrio sp. ML290]|uniref:hypothetical protein n=1 Tax=Salinivibrio sp. ML290 TaxID=1909468 RepID=UPI00098886FC|nr:hypothetical protein [Salinivibrio sp. ML290]OOE76340.1 hypothetical protein BZG23_02520 [Salinivibrio sp. ML290]
MSNLVDGNYIIKDPSELLNKLLFEAGKISGVPDKHDFFNFVVTAAILSEWVCKYYGSVIPVDLKKTLKGCSDTGLPLESDSWIEDRNCLPNSGQDASRHIINSVRICWHTTNATKHYEWRSSSGISTISTEAPINNLYDYFFTPVGESLFIRYKDENYTIVQIKDILIQFYPKLINYLDSLKESE